MEKTDMSEPDLPKLMIGNILRETFLLYRDRVLPMLALSLLANSLSIIQGILFQRFSPLFQAPRGGIDHSGRFVIIGILFILLILLALWANLVGTGAIIRMVRADRRGEQIGTLEAYGQAATYGWALFWTMVCVGMMVALGTGLLAGGFFFAFHWRSEFPPIFILMMLFPLLIFAMIGIGYSIRICFVYQTILLEDKRGWEALTRSWALTDGNAFKLWGLLLSIGLIFLIFYLPVTFIVSKGPLLILLQSLISILIVPLFSIATTLFYLTRISPNKGTKMPEPIPSPVESSP